MSVISKAVIVMIALLSMVFSMRGHSHRSEAQHRPAGAASLHSEGYLTGADGVRLFYRKVGRGPATAIFLHGGPGSNFRGSGDFMEPLAQRRTLIMYDQRGGGLSQIVTDPRQLTAEHHIQDLEALREHFNIKRISLIGLSWGAGLAVMYADRYPERVERLLLVSPMSPTKAFFDERRSKLTSLLGDTTVARRNELVRKLATANDKETVALCRQLSDITFRLYLAEATAEKLQHAASRCDIPAAAIKNRAVVEAATLGSIGDWDLRPVLKRLRMPALILEGQETNVPLDATRVFSELMPNARLLLLPNAGHELFVDQPSAFVKAANQFLGGRFPKGAKVMQSSRLKGNGSTPSVQEVESVILKLGDAWTINDVSLLETLLSDDYIHTDFLGRVQNRTEWLAYVRDRKAKGIVNRIQFDDVKVRFYRDAAVVTGLNMIWGSLTEAGKDSATRIRFTQMLVKQKGRWVRVSFQATPIVQR